METLVINYWELNSVTGTAKRILNKYDKRIDDYEGIRKKLSSIDSGGRNNLNQANYFLQKKSQKIQEKRDSLNQFIISVNNFAEEAKETDRRVARRIKDDFKTFKKANNLETTFFGYLQVGLEDLAKFWMGEKVVSVLERGGRNLKYQIKDWYHEQGGKYIIEMAADVVAVVVAVGALAAAIASGGVLAIFFAGFTLYNSGLVLQLTVCGLVV